MRKFLGDTKTITGWWFGTMGFYDFPYTCIGNSNPNWLIFFRGVETRWNHQPEWDFYRVCFSNCWHGRAASEFTPIRVDGTLPSPKTTTSWSTRTSGPGPGGHLRNLLGPERLGTKWDGFGQLGPSILGVLFHGKDGTDMKRYGNQLDVIFLVSL